MVPAPRLTAILTGPTASGKTAIALEFARAHPTIEIVNADSLLFQRGLDVGTAKPTPQELREVPHHLTDLIDPSQTFTAGDFHRAVMKTLDEIHSRGKRALIVGGSGFYLKALIYGLWEAPKADPELRARLDQRTSKDLYDELYAKDEEAALRIGVNDRYRLIRAHEMMAQSGLTPTELEEKMKSPPDPRFALLWIDRESPELETRIRTRAEQMIRDGILSETEMLLRDHPESRTLLAVGYRETAAYLQGKPPEGRVVAPGLAGLADEIVLGTRQLVKRQRTWYRGQFKNAEPSVGEDFILDGDREKLLTRLSEIYG